MSQSGAITGRDPATGHGIAVDVSDGLIAAVRPADAGDDLFLSPGFIDLQVNGYAGLDINALDVSPDDVAQLATHLLKAGVTTFAPTVITAAEPSIIRALGVIAEARQRSPLLAQMIPFIHVEGPSVSPEDGPRGAHPREHVRAPSIDEFERWQAACDGLVGLVTLSPHFAEAPAYIAELARRGVLVSIGHTAASPEQITAAVDAGARLSTHLGNGAAGMLPRHPNFIWTQLSDDRLTASFIADGHHLPAATFKAMLRAKTLDNAILVSDAAALGGKPPGIYDTPIGGRVEVSSDGRLGLAGTNYLAGAGHLLNQNIATAIAAGAISLDQALGLATRNPGRFVPGRGKLGPGMRADLIRFSWRPGDVALAVAEVFVAGRRLVP
jgi:N-acetylglucosamine-6-phosphate deacetylase